MGGWQAQIQGLFSGALTLGGLVIGLFFLRFWRRSKEGLFLSFCVAFWLLALNWLLVALIRGDEAQSALYTLRLTAFGVIIWGVWRKNRGGKPG
ncbi:MAG: hypothetical protein K2Q09_06375 [Phycisphaerales bacterium]|nr:hypothetical protein [Phycisphaerales bacterium]